MIDLRLMREDPERFRASQRSRNENPALVDALLDADARRRAAVSRADGLRASANAASKAIGAAAAADRPRLVAEAKRQKDDVRAAETEQAAAEALRAASYAVSNLVEDGVPPGGEEDYALLETVGEPPAHDFEPLDHVAIGERLGALDVERAAKVSGARFYYLTGIGALLELALVNMAVAQAHAAGFTPVIPPVLVKTPAMEGTGFLGQAAENVYRLPEEDLWLVGTSEVPLAAYHMDEVLDELPKRYAGISPCFRREAGSYGKDTRGMIRVHQFDKVEMFSFVDPADAAAEHRRLLDQEKEMLGKLELPYRVIDVAAGDLGSSAARKYDCEAWIPTQGRYRELTSTSNCTTFQARRLNIRHRSDAGVGPVATLNGTLIALSRTIVALLEVHQQADGSVQVPAALQPYLGCDVLRP